MDLYESERRLWRAVGCGAAVDLRVGDAELDDPAGAGEWGPERVVRAEVIAAVLLGAVPAEDGHVPLLHLVGARVSGKLDLSFARLVCPVKMEGCSFEEGVTLEEATTFSVRLVRCRMPYLEAGTITVQGHLELTGSELGWVDVYGAHISTELDLCDVRLTRSRAAAVNAELLHLDGSLYADKLSAHGPVNLMNAHIGGELRFDGAQLDNPAGDALSGEQLTVGGNVLCRDATVGGSVRLLGAQIGGSLDLSRARLVSPGAIVLYAARLRLGVDLIGIDGFTAVGEIRLHGARIEGAISFEGAHLDNASGMAFNAYRLGVGGGVFWSDGHATGRINLQNSQITGQIEFNGSTVLNPGGDAVSLNGTIVEGNVALGRGFTAEGMVSLWQTRVAGQVDFDGAGLANPGGEALCCRQLHADELRLTTATPIDGVVNLRYARVSVIRDDPRTWPAELELDGVVYEAIHPLLPVERRLAWLGSTSGEYLPHPYQQLATAYQKLGHDADARTVLVAKQRHRRASLPVAAKVWGYLQDATVGYGYRPLRAGLWLLALLALGTIVFWLAPPQAVDAGRGPIFNPLVYTLDLLVPIMNFGQGKAFLPRAGGEWLAYSLTVAGWVLATTVAAGITRVLRRQ